MISYAQNREDVLLQRCFLGKASGFYIDVGAWDPITDSVTQHFYSNGWSGINIEPVAIYFSRLEAERSRDINLNCALGATEGVATLHVFGETGLSTTHEPNTKFVESVAEVGHGHEAVDVPQMTLKSICAKYLPTRETEIDFLKVDVEGAEADVLRGGDWKRFRPRVVLLEAVRPVVIGSGDLTEIVDSYDEWEPLLLNENYLFAMTDGINRFYVRQEDSQLLKLLSRPVNVLDNYISREQWLMCREIDELKAEVDQASHALAVRTNERDNVSQQLQSVNKLLQMVLNSRA